MPDVSIMIELCDILGINIDELIKSGDTPATIVNKALAPVVTKQEKIIEEEQKRPRYVKFNLKLDIREKKYHVDNYAVAKLDYITFKEDKKELDEKIENGEEVDDMAK